MICSIFMALHYRFATATAQSRVSALGGPRLLVNLNEALANSRDVSCAISIKKRATPSAGPPFAHVQTFRGGCHFRPCALSQFGRSQFQTGYSPPAPGSLATSHY
jgi:hypothetical protein